jgi:predicted Zn-dependent protease
MHQAELEIDALRQTRSTNKAAWEKPRTLLLDANKRAPGDPMILEAYYDSFLAEGVLPPPGAQNALVKAFDLVPQDDDLRYKLASDFEQRQMIEDAIQIIKPAAFSLSEEENPAKRAKRERQEARYREVDEVKRETPREMLARLETKLAGRAKSAQGAK